MKAPTTIISPPKERSPPKYPGDATNDRRDNREPTAACRDAGESRACAYDPPHHAENLFEFGSKPPLLVPFAAIERHTVTMLVKAHEGEAQIGLPSVTLGIELDQGAADTPAEP
jgi:hypothetical protein